MRTFIAISLPDSIKKELSILQDRLKKTDADIKWVKPSNMHITLKFLGDIDDKTLNLISHAIREKTGICSCFDISISKSGAFPNTMHPKVIWAGIHEGISSCSRMQKEFDVCAEKAGIRQEAGAFSPHITIGRVRSQKNKQPLIDTLKKEKDFSINAKIPVKKITLFSSLITQRGPVYSILGEFPLPETC
jgi:RNA 2',3'-cyclic 3'-phosphodiesterase